MQARGAGVVFPIHCSKLSKMAAAIVTTIVTITVIIIIINPNSSTSKVLKETVGSCQMLQGFASHNEI